MGQGEPYRPAGLTSLAPKAKPQTIFSMQHEPTTASPNPGALPGRAGFRRWANFFAQFVACFGMVVIAAFITHMSVSLAASGTLTLIFLVPVMVSALRFGLWEAVFTSFLSVLCWDYFFTLPYYNFEFDDPRDIFALIAFLTVALIVSGLTNQLRLQNVRLKSLAESVQAFYEQSQELSQLATVDALASFVLSRVSTMLGCRAVISLHDHSDTSARLTFPVGETLSAEDTQAESASLPLPASNRLTGSEQGRYDFMPLNAHHGCIGSVGICRPDAPKLTREERRNLDVFLGQAALAIERAWLARDIEHATMTVEAERLRSALLTSVSHDLRTPLTTIIGALSTLKSMGTVFSPAIRAELISTARSEADRLNRFIGNLLDVTRLESGKLEARVLPTDVEDVIEHAVERAQPLLLGHVIEIAIPPDLPEASADFTLLEQVVFNLVDNAVKYSPSDSKIRIGAKTSNGDIVIDVQDEGCGIPEHAREKIFEKFSRLTQGDSVPPGTGLGLMICRGFLKVMGGTISASNSKDRRGAAFTIRLPRHQYAQNKTEEDE